MVARAVFMDVRHVRSRLTGASRFKAEWVARGGGTTLYGSKVCDTKEEAVKLAMAWLARHSYRDTTEHPERFGYEIAGTVRS